MPGLRRSEVAALAGMSVEYYANSNAALRPVRPSPQWSLDAVTAGPAIVVNNRQDLLAADMPSTA